MRKQTGQLSLSDGLLNESLGQNAKLSQIEALIDWSKVDACLSEVYAKRTGRPSYPVLLMFKSMLLQQWYGLSDLELEASLLDRLSFRRFVGLSLGDSTPDHSTLSRFRQQLVELDLGEPLFNQVLLQLDQRGLVIKQGTLIDASLVAAHASKPTYQSGRGRRGEVDPDADWTRRGSKNHYGYKAHIAVDQGSELIRRAKLSSAKISDSELADELIIGDEVAVYADKGYEHKQRRQRLKAQGIKDRIMHRSHKHQTQLPYWQQRRNTLIGPIRSRVERVFGLMKQYYGYSRVRYMSLARNQLQLQLLCLAINLRRATVLCG